MVCVVCDVWVVCRCGCVEGGVGVGGLVLVGSRVMCGGTVRQHECILYNLKSHVLPECTMMC